jgi:hypothetical protein
MADKIAFKKHLDDCRKQILILKPADRVPLKIAKFFIEHTHEITRNDFDANVQPF